MTELLREVETPSDAELISRVRGGDVAAYGELFSRHKTAANRLARQLVRGMDSDDLVAEAFAKVLTVLRGGGGPDVAFRAYLLTAVRRLHIDRIRSGQRLQTTDDMTPFDPGVPFTDTAVAGFERGAAAKAFASLPERWQLVLWHLEVEGQKPADIAPLLGMSANSVSALAYRAREGLRQAFLTMHLSDISETDCRWVNEHLGAFVRKGLSKRDSTKVQKHLDGCRRCSAMYLELNDVNSNLAGIIAPLLLGAAAAGYLASSGAGAAVGVAAAFSKVKEVVVANTGSAAAAGIAASVAAAAVIAVVVTQGGSDPSRNVVADPPAGVTSSGLPSGSPSALVVPTTGASTTGPSAGDPTAGTGVTPTAGASVSAPAVAPSVTPTFSLSPLPAAPVPVLAPTTAPATSSAGPSSAPSPSASTAPSATATATDTATATGRPSPGSSASPSPAGPPAPAVPRRIVGSPVLHANGSVTVRVRNARLTDTIDVTVTSEDTTFGRDVSVPGCRTVASRHVVCVPVPGSRARAVAGPTATVTPDAVTAGAARAAPARPALAQVAVTLPLAYPDSMVSDELEVTAGVRGVRGASASTGRQVFRPTRTPAFDVGAPVLSSPVHTLVGDEDRYDIATTAVLPRRVTGLVYTQTGPARFRAVGGSGCTVGAGGRTLRCSDVANGDRVNLPLAATGLTGSARVGIRVSPVDRFVDPSPGDTTASTTLRPGADLGLSLRVTSADALGTVSTMTGRLTGVRPGLRSVVYTLSSRASFPAGDLGVGNPGCTGAGATLSCPVAADGTVALTVASATPGVPVPLTVSVGPAPPFEQVGAGPHSATVTLPDHGVHDFSFTGLREKAHALVPDDVDGTDRYTLTGAVGPLPPDVGTVAFTAGAGAVFAEAQTQPGCTRSATPQTGGQVLCSGLAGGSSVDLVVDVPVEVPGNPAAPASRNSVTVTMRPSEAYADPDADDNVASIAGLQRATHLVLTRSSADSPLQGEDGSFPVSVKVAGIRAGLDGVVLGLSGGLQVKTLETGPCTVVDRPGTPGTPGTPEAAGGLRCTGLGPDEPVDFTVTTSDPDVGGDLVLTARPDSDVFVNLGEQNTVTASLVPTYDFTMPDLTETAHTLAGGTDGYTLTGAVPALPTGLGELRLQVTGGDVFAVDQADGCTRDATEPDRQHLVCRVPGPTTGLTLHVESTSTAAHSTGIRVLVPAGYRDPVPGNDVSAVHLAPGVDLHLGALDPDNESPHNDDDTHVVDSELTGVREGLASVVYALTGVAAGAGADGATFAGVDGASCTGAGTRTLTCQAPADGDVRFRVTTDESSSRAATDVTITASPGRPFVELDDDDNTRSTTLTARPSYNFAMGSLELSDRTVTGDSDLFTLTSTVPAPAGVDELRFEVDGGTFATEQPDGCRRVDVTRVTCGGLGASSTVALRVGSTSTSAHDVVLTVLPPADYRDPSTSNNSSKVRVTPGVDLHLGLLTPADPVPEGGDYQVSGVLTRVRSGPVMFEVSGGATVRATSCTRTSATMVTCAGPTNGQSVGFTLTPTNPTASTLVTIRAATGAGFLELDDRDNAATTRLAPDVTLSALAQRSSGNVLLHTAVRAQVTGVPAGVSTVRLHLSGTDVGPGRLRFTSGASGADGEGDVDCYTSTATGGALTEGVDVTCTGVASVTGGSFFVDTRLTRLPLTTGTATFTVHAVGADEGAHGDNNSRDIALRWPSVT